MRHNGGWLAMQRGHDAHGQLAYAAFVLAGGSNSSGANSSCHATRKLARASKRQPGSHRVLRPPEGAHLGKGAPCSFRRSKVYDEFATLIKGKDLGGVLSDCLLLHIPNTTRWGQAHATANWRRGCGEEMADSAKKRPHNVPVLEAHRTRQMDKVGGYMLNPGVFRRHGNLRKMSMDD